jgi:hypothetical protein
MDKIYNIYEDKAFKVDDAYFEHYKEQLEMFNLLNNRAHLFFRASATL